MCTAAAARREKNVKKNVKKFKASTVRTTDPGDGRGTTPLPPQSRKPAAYFTLNGRGVCHVFTQNRCILKDFG